MILNKKIFIKIISNEDDFEKINYVGKHSAARLGRGFQIRPFGPNSPTVASPSGHPSLEANIVRPDKRRRAVLS